ncbi:hypothetical protein ISS86_01230 [Candidatus Microgenomates bacterium]|nr:hypothetical protein [Candidatus Microgenomates bacterium]
MTEQEIIVIPDLKQKQLALEQRAFKEIVLRAESRALRTRTEAVSTAVTLAEEALGNAGFDIALDREAILEKGLTLSDMLSLRDNLANLEDCDRADMADLAEVAAGHIARILARRAPDETAVRLREMFPED